jgi:hypothetical protein
VPTLAAVVITRPFTGASTFLSTGAIPPRLTESGWLLLIGGGLMALGVAVRRATEP